MKQLPVPRDHGFWLIDKRQAEFRPFRLPPDMETPEPQRPTSRFSSLPALSSMAGARLRDERSIKKWTAALKAALGLGGNDA